MRKDGLPPSREVSPTTGLSIKGNQLVFKDALVAVNPDLLQAALLDNQEVITTAIRDDFARRKAADPEGEVHQLSMRVGELGRGFEETLSARGRANRTRIHYDIEEISDDVHMRALWQAVVNSGFVPEVRSDMGKESIALLFLRLAEDIPEVDMLHKGAPNPETIGHVEFDMDTLSTELGLISTREIDNLEEAGIQLVSGEHTPDQIIELMHQHRSLLEEIVDVSPSGNVHQRMQLGLLVRVADFKHELGFDDEYLEDLYDMLDVAEALGDDKVLMALETRIEEMIALMSVNKS